MADRPRIDSHAHVWDRHCTFVAGARYHPGYEATIDSYLRVLDAHDINRAVLVQPSFLGTDNRYLLDALRACPDRLRGIVVLDPATSASALDDMTALGVIGLRYNLLSMAPGDLAAPAWQDLTARASARQWWIEVQAKGEDWPAVLDLLTGARLMIDHFGKPSGPDCPGQAGLRARRPERTCVKLSAPYRQQVRDLPAIAQGLMDQFTPARCLWGSDWPWTQHEGRHSYARSQAWLDLWTTPEQRAAMAATEATLLGFAAPSPRAP